jgi:hypothetical protein
MGVMELGPRNGANWMSLLERLPFAATTKWSCMFEHAKSQV